MRDGVYKDLPQPRPWRGLVRSCTREAERGAPARQRAERALVADLGTEITPGFLRQFRRRAEDSAALLPGMSSFDGIASSRDLGGENTPLENLVVDHARRLERTRVTGDRLAHEALEAALADWTERRFRHLAQHCLTKAGEAARPTLEAAREALAAQDFGALARRRLAGERSPRGPTRRAVDLDEDLTNPQ